MMVLLSTAPATVREHPDPMAIDRADEAPHLGPRPADGRIRPEQPRPQDDPTRPERPPAQDSPTRPETTSDQDSPTSPEPSRVQPEPRSRAEAYADLRRADSPPPAADAHTTPDGGWSWKSLGLSRADNQVADQQLAARRHAEGRHPDGSYDDRGLTPTLRRIESQLDHGALVPDTERFALKSPDRFKEKLAKLMGTEPDRPAADLAAEIHDGIRYTYILSFQPYCANVDKVRRLLGEAGCDQVAFKPSWSGDEYKGINSQWRDRASGQLFEVQFHTQESWEAKQITHAAYEKIESPETTAADRARLREYQRDVTAQIPIPPGALDFVSAKQKGR